jgi:hypothetical protein
MIKETTQHTGKYTCYKVEKLKHMPQFDTPILLHTNRCEEEQKENKLCYGNDRYVE